MPKTYQKKKSYAWIWVAALPALVIGMFALSNKGSGTSSSNGAYLTPAEGFADVHGLSVDPADGSKLYIATHQGLLLLKDDKSLYQVGPARDDYMGFSQDPIKPDVFYTAGHDAAMTGNKGFQRSDDGGRSWKQIGLGASGRAEDFHALAVSAADTNVIYGSAMGQLERSIDGGSRWELLKAAPNRAIGLAAGPSDKGTVYAATATGLKVSHDQGATWSDTGLTGQVMTIVVNPSEPKELLASSENQGLIKSVDQGATWTPLPVDFAKTGVMYLAYDKHDPKVVYAMTQELGLYKTTDGGKSWNAIRNGRG